MAKTLSFTDTSPQQVKHGDTTTTFNLVCGNDNVATDLTGVTGITVKIGDDTKLIDTESIAPASVSDPDTGVVELPLNADLMGKLTTGKFQLEVWVVDSNGTAIYPSDGSLQFQVNNSLE